MKKIRFLLFSLLLSSFIIAQNIEAIQFDADPENLGEMVNSQGSELSPQISPDGKILFITRYPESNNGKNNIWFSSLQENGEWTLAKNIGTPLNIQGYSTSVQSITPDGNTILLSNIYRYFDGTVSGGGCSISTRQRGGWSFPKQQIIDKFENKNQYVNYCLSNNGKVMLMAIEKKKGLGEKDIWVSFLEEKNEWSKPLNLGNVVNTEGDEFGPFLAADEKTLYFVSEGHPGFGGADVWMTKRLDDTWTNWSPPINMGDKINTPDFDAYFSIAASGEYAYFASGKSGFGKSDIFRIKMPTEAKPEPVVLISGSVYDSKTNQPIMTEIVYEILPEGKEVGVARSEPEKGAYKIVLPYGKSYGFLAKAEGYYPVSDNFDVTDLKQYQEIKRDLYLTPIKKMEVGEIVRLNNIFFETAKAELKEESAPELKRVVKLLNEKSAMQIEISGHTDNVGADEANLRLSQERAQAVVDYLIEKGVKKNRLVAKGYGETILVAANDTDKGKALNRRVEFKILKN
jgi:outer membrane protein OmpA-like peptidoglycan-associated protein